MLEILNDVERDCLNRYVALLRDRLGDRLLGVSVYGSVARGEPWPAGMPIRSDLDLLVVTRDQLAENVQQELVDATYPLFLESGRQLGPVFRTPERLDGTRFWENVENDAIAIWPEAAT